jgi:hypothetical protein
VRAIIELEINDREEVSEEKVDALVKALQTSARRGTLIYSALGLRVTNVRKIGATK